MLFISQERYEFYKNRTGAPTKDDVLFNGGGEIGKSLLITDENLIYVQGGAVLYARTSESSKLVGQYLKIYFETTHAKSYIDTTSAGGTMKHFTLKPSQMMPILMPSVDEQEKIGTYFSNLDHLITLHQRQPFLHSPPDISLIVQLTPPFYTFSWEQRELWELTIWDKKFNEVEAEKQPKIIKYPYVLADVFSKIEDASGDVRLLSTGNYIGYTTDEKAGKNLCVGEVVAIPWGGVPNIKYYKGKFVTADNRIATSNDTETLGNRFLSLYLEHSLAFLQSIYRGASIKHPSMNDVLSMQISIPHIQEQREIETWFANLDNLITLHQRQTIVYAVIRSIRKVILAERQYFAPPMVRKSP